MLKHFREQVTPYLQAEKARKQEQIENKHKQIDAKLQELEAELDNEFTFDDGVKI